MLRCSLIPVLCCLSSIVAAADPVDFQHDVAPILQKHCAGCHGADDPDGGFSLDSPAGLLAGGDSGVAVTPGASSSSRLWLMVSGQLEPAMPPEDQASLNEQQLAVLEAWIDQGAEVGAGAPSIKRPLRTPQIEPRQGIKAPITALASSPDGALRAMARFGQIELVGRDGSLIRTIPVAAGKVNSLQFSRDGSQLLIASGVTGAYGMAAVVSVATGDLVTELLGHRDILYAAVFSPDQSLIATAGYDREIMLWDAGTGELVRSLRGHNGAVFDLAFAPDGKVIVSGSADETVKVWHVKSGQRLDTLSQCEGEVLAVAVTADGKQIVAASADNRLRVWSLVSTAEPQINPLLTTRFVDESALVSFQIAPDGKALVVLSEAGNVKVIRTADWTQAAVLENLGETASDMTISPDSRSLAISLLSGEIVHLDLPEIRAAETQLGRQVDPIYLDLGPPQQQTEAQLRQHQGDGILGLQRGAEITGTIAQPGETDSYRWSARQGEVWAIDADAIENSRIDPVVTVLDGDSVPVLRAWLQAVRESYFTFRGKDSKQISDFRLFNWQQMRLNEYLYAAGEVTRLYMHPRGPDSGFNVYPGEGTRWTYFGTSHRAHALGEPAYIVRALAPGEPPLANGLPVFDVPFENDDDPSRLAGNNSRLLFTAPADGLYTIRLADTSGAGGSEFGYKLAVRAAVPRFRPYFEQPKTPILRGAGREFNVRVDRFDGFSGAVTFEIVDLPAGLVSNSPITIEPGQRFASANIWADESIEAWPDSKSARLVAHANVAGRRVERQVGEIKDLKIGDRPKAIPSIHPIGQEVPENEAWTLQVRRGQTVSARILVRRTAGYDNQITFGKELSGRNATHGVYVDNIGLNGLLVRAGESEREFFLTADPISQPGRRLLHLRAAIDGNITTHPIVVEVLP